MPTRYARMQLVFVGNNAQLDSSNVHPTDKTHYNSVPPTGKIQFRRVKPIAKVDRRIHLT